MSKQSAPALAAACTFDGPLEAVLFDMDGVITDTANAHAVAWQRLFDEFLKQRADGGGDAFQPFDVGQDYRRYVDGKPRYDGVGSFLASRGIELPWGREGDDPDARTVCGLGNRKDRYFRAWLDENRVRAYPGTLKFIDALRKASVKVASFSASRNADAVLSNAGALELFDARVDGGDLARLDLPGKPDPAMLIEAAVRLGASPGRTVVVEDSIAGVEAGARGGFGCVIGVARGGHGDELRRAGAHLVVGDLAELMLSEDGELGVKTLVNLPGAWQREDEIVQRLAGKEPVVFLDYDGTLTPIVEDHTRAFLAADMRDAVQRLSRRCKVAIVSGRDLEMLRGLVQLDSVYYAGSHGFEIGGPDGARDSLERGVEFLPELDEVEQALRKKLADIDGHSVERKRFSIAVHYRQVAEDDAGKLEAIVDGMLAEHPRLHRGLGKKVFELQPDIDWNKGHAVLWLLERLGVDRAEVVPLYVGDDVTDENAFRALAGEGLTVVVRDDEPRPTAADYALSDIADVRRFLERLIEIAQGARTLGRHTPRSTGESLR